jgi:hypothetical protein
LNVFTHVTIIDKADAYVNGKLTPALAKLNLYKYLMFDENVYLDVDGVCISDVAKAFEQDKEYAAESLGYEPLSNKAYGWRMHWATGQTIADHYSLPMETKIPFINSSFQYIKKGAFCEKLFTKALDNFANCIPLNKLKNQWGKSQPDELYMNVACGQLGYDPTTAPQVYFRTRSMTGDTNVEALREKFTVVGLFGTKDTNHRIVRLIYNGEMAKIFKGMGMPYMHKIESLMNSKFMRS